VDDERAAVRKLVESPHELAEWDVEAHAQPPEHPSP
jgi:hypothetical protein